MSTPTHRVRTPFLVLLVFALLLFSFLARHSGWTLPCLGERVRGSGHAIDQVRTVTAFRHIRLKGSFDVEAEPGDHEGVVVHADDNVAPLIRTEVVDDTLVVDARPRLWLDPKTRITVRITSRVIDAVEDIGSGNLVLRGLNGGNLDLKLVGSGDIRGAGQLDQLTAELVGSGDIKFGKVPSRRVAITLNGSGNASVQARDRLEVQLNGSGDILFSGHPADVTGRVNGSGSLTQQD
jgi:hypothetical protein